MANSKPTGDKTTAEKKKPTSAALKAAVAQLEEEETGKKKNTTLLRVGAVVLWILAAVAMYMPQIGQMNLPFGAMRMIFLDAVTEAVVDIVVAGVLVVLAALLWKKANHIHPTKAHSKVLQFIWNQLGLLLAGVIFAPLAIIMIVKSDKIDERMKKIVSVVLAVMFLAAAAGSADYHPVTQDEVNEILAEADENGYTGDAYWTKYGHSYHFSLNCQSLRNSKQENIYAGTLEEALDANRTDPCDFCADGSLEKMANDAVDEVENEAEAEVDEVEDGTEDEVDDAA